MTTEQYGQWLEDNESRESWTGPVEAEVSPTLTSVVSVRFNKRELSQVSAAAADAGVKLSTFIRELVLAQVADPDATTRMARTLLQDKEAIEAAALTLSSVVRHLRAVPGSPRDTRPDDDPSARAA